MVVTNIFSHLIPLHFHSCSTERSRMRTMCWRWTTRNKPTPSPVPPMTLTMSDQHEFPNDLLSPLNLHAPLSFALTKPHVWTLTFALCPGQEDHDWPFATEWNPHFIEFKYASTWALNFCVSYNTHSPFFYLQIKLSAFNCFVLFYLMSFSMFEVAYKDTGGFPIPFSWNAGKSTFLFKWERCCWFS